MPSSLLTYHITFLQFAPKFCSLPCPLPPPFSSSSSFFFLLLFFPLYSLPPLSFPPPPPLIRPLPLLFPSFPPLPFPMCDFSRIGQRHQKLDVFGGRRAWENTKRIFQMKVMSGLAPDMSGVSLVCGLSANRAKGTDKVS
jgi:hypothetical protein